MQPGPGIALKIRIQNIGSTAKDWNPAPGIWNPRRGIQNPRLISWIPVHEATNPCVYNRTGNSNSEGKRKTVRVNGEFEL